MVELDEIPSAFSTQGQQEAGPSVILENAQEAKPVDIAVASELATKAHWALDKQSPGHDVIKTEIASGLEGKLRERLAIQEAIKKDEEKVKLVQKYVEMKKLSGQPINQADITYMQQLSIPSEEDPKTFLEKKFGERVAETAFTEFASKHHPEFFGGSDKVDPVRDALADRISRQEILKRLDKEMEDKQKAMGNFERAWDVTETIIPFATYLDLKNAMKEAPASSWLLGNNMEEQVQSWYNMPLPQAADAIERTVREIATKNVANARHYLAMMMKFTASDQFGGNFMTIADVSTIPGITMAKVAQGVARSVNKYSTFRIPTVMEAAGDIERAGIAMVTEEMGAKIAGTPRGNTFKAIVDDAQPLFNPGYMTENGTLHSQQYKARLQDLLETNAAKLVDAGINRPITIDRLIPGSEAYEAAIAETHKLFNKLYPEVNDSILAVRPVYGRNTAANTDHIAIDLGDKTATYFPHEAGAKFFAEDLYGLRPAQYKVMQNGDGWFIRMTKAIDETSPTVRNMLQVETKNQTPRGFLNTFVGALRTNEDKLPKIVLDDMKVATYGASGLTRILKEVSKEIGKVKDTDSFMAFVSKQRDYIDKTTKERGRFSKDVGEFERDWTSQFKRNPTEQETRAYFTYVQLNNLDWVLRNLSIYRDKSRLGLELYAFPIKGITQKMPQVEGKLLSSLEDVYRHKESANILIWGDDPAKFASKENFQTRDFFSKKRLGELEKEGYKVFHISDFGEETLRAMPYPAGGKTQTLNDVLSKRKITYILAKDAESAPLSFKQIPNKPGGHVDYMDGFFVSQPQVHATKRGNVTLHHYYGDKNAFHFTSEGQANKFTERMEVARKLLKDGKTAELDNYLRSNLPFSSKSFREMFEGDGIFDVQTPFFSRAKGQSVEDAHKISQRYNNFTNIKDSPHNLYQNSVGLQFAGKRNQPLYTIQSTGSETNPAFNFRPAQLIDPIGTLDRAADNMMRGRYLDDLKIKAAERFVAEFGDILEMPLQQARKDPFAALIEGKFNPAVKDAEKIAIAKNYRRSTIEFLGLKNDFEKSVDQAVQRLADAIGEKPIKLVDDWSFGTLRDPAQTLRSIAFHKTMGLFNPVPFFTQIQTGAHIASLAGPVVGFNASTTSVLSRAALRNPKILDLMDQQAVKFSKATFGYSGWKPGQFKEAHEAMVRTGFWNVGGEYSVVDQFFTPQMINSKAQSFLDAGTLFFREGELMTRLAAWNASYLEFRALKPTAKLTNSDLSSILARADMMTVNMSRASNASWQRGFLSIPTQFLSYPVRLAEQLIGKRLTTQEKARAFLTYGALYGTPVAAGAAVGVWPIYESLRTKLLEKGVDYDDNVVKRLLMDGIPATIGEAITGTKYDVGSRFGPGGAPNLRNLLDGKWIETLLGAGGSAIKDGFALQKPFTMSIMSAVRGDQETYPIDWSDVADAMSTISTANQVRIFYNGVFLNEYITRNDMRITSKIKSGEAAMAALTGMKPQDINDMWSKYGSIKYMRQVQAAEEKDAIKHFRRGIDEAGEGKDELAADHFKRAKLHMIKGGFRPDQWGQVLGKALSGYEDKIDEIDRQFINGDLKRLEAWKNKIERREQK